MQKYISLTKQKTKDMINKVKETYPNLHNRFAIVVYWDFDVNNSKTSVLNFTNNLDML